MSWNWRRREKISKWRILSTRLRLSHGLVDHGHEYHGKKGHRLAHMEEADVVMERPVSN
jgi:hypothetical protein